MENIKTVRDQDKPPKVEVRRWESVLTKLRNSIPEEGVKASSRGRGRLRESEKVVEVPNKRSSIYGPGTIYEHRYNHYT